MKKLELVQGSKEWLEARKLHITSTDAAIICGKNPFKSLRELILQKQGILPEEEPNDRMKKGSEMEALGFINFKEMVWDGKIPLLGESGDFNYSVCGLYEKDPAFMASLDGLSEDGKVVLEIKCGKKAYEQLVKHKKIPEYYIYQMQHALMVSEANMAIYFCYWEKEPAWAIVLPDKEIHQEIFEKRILYYAAYFQSLEESS